MAKKAIEQLKNRRGSAMMLAIFTTTLVIFLTNEVAQETIMAYLTSATEVKKVKAKYAAESCVRLSLLRIKAFQQATRSLGQALPDTSMLDMIWNFPLSWPPNLPQEISGFDSSTINKTVAGSLLKEQFISSISPEGGKIDINDLASPSQVLQQRTRLQLLQRIQVRVLNGRDSFSERYANFNFEILLNNITDWIDADQVSLNGGAEQSYYSDFKNRFLPPNRPFKTLEELHMIDGMTDEIYEELAPQITLYGVKGINVNQADRDVLMSLFNSYPTNVAEQIITEIFKRRNDPMLGGPFRDNNDFMGFLGGFLDTQTFQQEENRVPLFFGPELNFRISCIGLSGKMNTEIEAVVYDAESVTQRLQNSLAAEQSSRTNPECANSRGEELYVCLCQNVKEEKARQSCIENKKRSMSGRGQGQGPAQPAPLPQGPPRIIFQSVR